MSVLYLLGEIGFYITLFLLRKSEKKLNGVIWLIITLLLEMCWSVLTAGILNLVHIPINITSIGLVYLVSAVLLGVKLYRDKEVQKYRWNVLDIVFTVLVFAGVTGIVLYKAGPQLGMTFHNSDAAVHLKNAVQFVQEEHLPTMYFAPFQLGMLIEIAKPVVAIYSYYKIFLLFDAFLFALEISLFVLYFNEYVSKRWMQVAGFFFALLCAAGYPMHSYLFSFYYWGLGVALMLCAAYLLQKYRRQEIRGGYALFALMLVCNGVTMCYMLFGPLTFVAVFFCLISIMRKEGTLVCGKNIVTMLQVFLLPTILAVYYCYVQFLQKQAMSASDVMTIDGGIYRELYANFILLIPFVLYALIRAFRKKQVEENTIFFITTAVCVLILFVLTYKDRMSGYYFFKFYYPLWVFAFALTFYGVLEMKKEHWESLLSYGALIVFLFVMHYGHIESKIIEHKKSLLAEEYASMFFNLYDNNKAWLVDAQPLFTETYMELCRYKVDHLSGEEVPLLSSQEGYAKCYWYEAATGEDCSDYYGWQNSYKEIIKKLKANGVKYVAVYREDSIYGEHASDFEKLERVYDNGTGCIWKLSE